MNAKDFLHPDMPLGQSARLVSVAEPLPTNLEVVLKELGAGDSFFWGTAYGRGECDLPTFLQVCRDEEAGRNLPVEKVPQSTFWMVDDHNQMVGIVRVRHRLNERLLQYGGNVGYYIRPSERGKGHGKKLLELALEKFRQLGGSKALLTVNPNNTLSARVVLANGGVADIPGKDPVSGEIVNRYWIEV
ncbi:MAG TPA: GNAT family N-acetyltransferase [Verrucomicrobiae bacterium]|jgi:predicted acetyltransferase